MKGTAQHGVHGPNVPFAEFRRRVGDSPPSASALWYRLGLSRARWIKLLATDHTPQDARDAQAAGLKILLRVRGEGTVFHRDVLQAIHEYQGLASVLEIGNEPELEPEKLWTHAWYVEKVWQECAGAARAAQMRLCIGGWRMGQPPPNPSTSLGQRLLELYGRFDLIGVHCYDPFDLMVPYVTAHLHRWIDAFPDKHLMLTEYGIAARSVPERIKAERYAEFLETLPPKVEAAFAFLLGGTPDFAAFTSGGYDPRGENSYWLDDRAWECLGQAVGS